jgi:hypothetical protein
VDIMTQDPDKWLCHLTERPALDTDDGAPGLAEPLRGPEARAMEAAVAQNRRSLGIPGNAASCPECHDTGMVQGEPASWSNPYGEPPEQCPRGCEVPGARGCEAERPHDNPVHEIAAAIARGEMILSLPQDDPAPLCVDEPAANNGQPFPGATLDANLPRVHPREYRDKPGGVE